MVQFADSALAIAAASESIADIDGALRAEGLVASLAEAYCVSFPASETSHNESFLAC